MRASRPRPGLLLLGPVLAGLLGVALLTPAAPVVAGEEPVATDEPGRLVLVLDSSGSMAEPAAGGGTKIQAAKDALGQVVEELPDDAEVGIRVFGAEVFDRSEPGACTDSRAVVPVGPLDRESLTEAVAEYQPYGETPIGHALREAGKDLGPGTEGGQRTIVLLSDGEPTCQPDPCQVAAQLADRGIDLTINVVGLDVSGKAREALRCIARAGNGDYYDASSAEELASSMVKVSVRELRRFRLDGERVTGGTGLGDALLLEPGTYVDTSTGKDRVRTYLVDRPLGGGVTASVLARPPRGEENWHTAVHLKLMTPDGSECAQSLDQEFQVLGQTPLAAAGVEHHQLSGGWRHEECMAAEQLVVSVGLSSKPTDYQLRLGTHGRIENVDELPGPVESREGDWVDVVELPSRGRRIPVAGGVNFADAPELEPGTTYSDTLRPSEQLTYRVAAEYGQAVRVTARLKPDRHAADRLGYQGNPVRLWVHSALWQSLPTISGHDRARGYSMYSGDGPAVLTAAVPPLRLSNATSPSWHVQEATRGGDQLFVLGMGALDDDLDFAAPVELRAEVLGEPEGEPEYAGEEAPTDLSASPSDTAPNDDDEDAAGDVDEEDGPDDGTGDGTGAGTVLWWVLGAAAVLAVLVVSLALVRRSRRSGGTGA